MTPDDDTPAEARSLLDFWLKRDRKDWFAKRAELDAEIRARFGALYEAAAAGRLAHWMDAPRGCLALVILLDQLARNMFRGEARAFAADPLARAAARRILERGWDRDMTHDERTFAYLPFEHSEALEDQELACRLFAPLGEELLRYAQRHREIIERFGRFPHRNAVLGRQNTAAEIEFLKQPGSSF